MYRPIIFMFSGQGSHYFQMGKELFKNNPVFKEWMLKIDTIATDLIGQSIVDLIYHDQFKKSDIFNRTLYTHPSIFMVEYALSQVFLDTGITPDYVLGTSLGEFTSAVFSGVLEIEDAVRAIVKQAEILEDCCSEGGMLAVLDDPELYEKTSLINDKCELAAVNFDSHFVLSGNKNAIKSTDTYLTSRKINFQHLAVSHGFHSSSIDPGEKVYKAYLKKYSFQPPVFPMISSAQGDVITQCSGEYFWRIIRNPILFRKTIQRIEDKDDYIYLDLGPSGTLATFTKYNLKSSSGSETYAVLTPFGKDLKNLETVKNKISSEKSIRKDKETIKMVTYLFPGQGSQKKGMGETLFEEFADLTAKADDILGYDIKRLCVDDPENLLGQTQYTQPALYIVNAFSYLKKINETRTKPAFVAGHSLGEYNALFAAGAFDFEIGLKLVKKRGALMSQASGGGMAAIIGMNAEKISSVITANSLKTISIANYNTPSQIVIAGPKKDIDLAKSIFEDAGVRLYIPLNVSGAFHTKYMEPAKEEFSAYLSQFELSELKIPVISNVTARPYEQHNLRENLVQQMTCSVQWTDSIRYLMGKQQTVFEEIGPGKVLTGMVQKIKKEASPLIIQDEENKFAEKTTLAVTKTTETRMLNRADQNHDKEKGDEISADLLGSDEFKKDYNLKYAYVTGGMYRGIASKELVARIGKAGMIGFLGTGGMSLDQIEEGIAYIKKELSQGQSYGMNLLNSPMEIPTVDLYLKHGIRNIEAAAYMQMTPGLVRYRLNGLEKNGNGTIAVKNKIIGKCSRPEVAEAFLSPAPDRVISALLSSRQITREQAELSKYVPMADDLCVEADSGGHTDQGVAYAIMPAMLKLRDDMMRKYKYQKQIRVGAAGGIGTPEAAAAAFILGADFILTGSINQCTVEAGTSDAVKDILQNINVQDTDYAPAGDMFELGARVQVVKKGVFFPARANKLYSLYQHFNSLDEIDDKTRRQLQEKYFKQSFDEIYNECKLFYPPYEIAKADKNPKHKMAMTFKWYFGLSSQLAISGDEKRRVDFQINTGPALGAFNQWVKGTALENWRNRHVDEIAEKLICETAVVLNQRFRSMTRR